jgi:hypothetical protein
VPDARVGLIVLLLLEWLLHSWVLLLLEQLLHGDGIFSLGFWRLCLRNRFKDLEQMLGKKGVFVTWKGGGTIGGIGRKKQSTSVGVLELSF